jgi:hypothetical protein
MVEYCCLADCYLPIVRKRWTVQSFSHDLTIVTLLWQLHWPPSLNLKHVNEAKLEQMYYFCSETVISLRICYFPIIYVLLIRNVHLINNLLLLGHLYVTIMYFQGNTLFWRSFWTLS